MENWAQSKQQPGQFTGSTGANILSAAELSSGYQAWARKVLPLNIYNYFFHSYICFVHLFHVCISQVGLYFNYFLYERNISAFGYELKT